MFFEIVNHIVSQCGETPTYRKKLDPKNLDEPVFARFTIPCGETEVHFMQYFDYQGNPFCKRLILAKTKSEGLQGGTVYDREAREKSDSNPIPNFFNEEVLLEIYHGLDLAK